MRHALRLMDWLGLCWMLIGMRSMRVYHQKYSYYQQFIDEVLNYCVGKPEFIVDNVYGLTYVGGVRLTYNTKPSDRSLVESYIHHSREQKYSQQHQTHQQSKRFRRSTLCWNLLIKLLYYTTTT